MVVHLESWVTQQYKEVGFGKDGNGPFIGKPALKKRLISCYPEHKKKIRQLVNSIKHQDVPARSVPPSKAVTTSSKMETPSTPTYVKPKLASQYPVSLQPKQVSPTKKSKISIISSQNSDSGSASYSEDENTLITSNTRSTRTMGFQSHFPKSEDGGASLDALLSTISRTRRTAETSSFGTLAKFPSNLKMMELKKFVSQAQDLNLAPQDEPEDGSSTLNLQLGLLDFSSAPGTKKINVLVSPSNFLSMKALYTQIPCVKVNPFKLQPKDLNISTMLTLMSVNKTEAAPLYMGIVTKILRDMASKTAEGFDYPEFRRQLDDAGLDRKQTEFLTQRLDLLESFLDLDGSTVSPDFTAGEITIIDLSCPFVDASTACVLFKVGMGLYLESDSTVGKVIVLDEAHKYMTDTPASTALTESLMGVIRQQRHYGARVIISTQEPTISPKLIDLCSITIIHRFSSPEWLDVLKRHLPVFDRDGDKSNKADLLKKILRLKTGEALVFAPSAILGASDDAGERKVGTDTLFSMRIRKRVTWDGGKSILFLMEYEN
ncbi:hypothetical protein IFR05_009958 [Cadophora sp. M221]|nr:hypothetical protein IFR05_009958 [Cadophora sp. M221]